MWIFTDASHSSEINPSTCQITHPGIEFLLKNWPVSLRALLLYLQLYHLGSILRERTATIEIQQSSSSSKRFAVLFAVCPSLCLLSQTNTNLFFITVSLLAISRILNVSIQYHSCVLLHSLSIIILNTSYVIKCIGTSFHFIAERYSAVWMSTFCFCSLSIDGPLDCFPFQVIWIKPLWVFMYVSLQGHTFSFLLGKYLGVE